jgi:hypothetical protein
MTGDMILWKSRNAGNGFEYNFPLYKGGCEGDFYFSKIILTIFIKILLFFASWRKTSSFFKGRNNKLFIEK